MSLLLCLCIVLGLGNLVASEWSYEGHTITLAHLNISYSDPESGQSRIEVGEVGKFGMGAVGSASGVILVGESYDENGLRDRRGCRKVWDVSPPPEGRSWIALVAKGGCSDTEKVQNAMNHNASAVLVYAQDSHAHLQKLALSKFRFGEPDYGDGGAVVVFLGHLQGEQLARLAENGTKVIVTITRGQDVKFRFNNINKTSVLFVSVSFIILMVISLAWLIFYYIQRFRYIHAKDKLARHLCNAAKKALSKIPVKSLKTGDKEVISDNECCAICIECYQVSDNLRVLPCKHQFHKVCVDPWLLEHRTCPMCKMDILKHYGYVLSGSEESIIQMDVSEETPTRDVEAAPTDPTSPSNNDNNTSNNYNASTATNTNVEVVMISQEGGLRGAEAAVCEGWTDSPGPDTPISPVHQAVVNTPATTASASVLSSMIGSARALASQAARVHQSSQVSSAVEPLKLEKCRTPLPPIKDVCSEKGTSGAVTAEPIQEDLEVASVCSQDFSDNISIRSDIDAAIDEMLRTTDEIDNRLSSIGYERNIDNLPSNIVTVINEEGSPVNSEDSDSTTMCSPLRKCAGGSARNSRSSARRSASMSHSRQSPSKSHSRRRSTSRSRSRKRSSSKGRSTSRGRSAGILSSTSQLQSTQKDETRPSSHVVSVSHF